MIDKLSVVLLCTYALGGASGLLCAPSCSNATGVIHEGQKVPNPSDCYEYYICSDVNGDTVFEVSDEALRCSDGLYFNTETKSCRAIPTNGDPYCTNMCSPCAVACSSPGETLPDPASCSDYYVCLSGAETDYVHVGCDPDLLYDFTKNSCQPADTARCFEECDECKVYCVLEGRIPNPADCTGYLYCEPPDQYVQFHCAEGDVYNPATKECEHSEEGCQNSCGGNTTVTTTGPGTSGGTASVPGTTALPATTAAIMV